MEEKNIKKLILVGLFVLICIGIAILSIEYKSTTTKKVDYFSENEIEIITNRSEENANEIELEVSLPKEGLYEYSFDGGETWGFYNKYVISENKEIVIMAKDHLGNIVAKKTYKVEVADTSGPVINVTVPKEIYKGTNININDYIEIIDPSGVDVVLIDKDNFNTDTVGDKEIKITAIDKLGNKTELSFVVTVLNVEESSGEEVPSTNLPKENKKTTYYRYRVKSTSSYECNYYDCSYTDQNDTVDPSYVFGADSYCCDSGKCGTKINPTISYPCPLESDACIQVMTLRYKVHGNVCYDSTYIEGTPSKEPVTCNGINCNVDNARKRYSKTICSLNEIKIDGYCHKIDSYAETSCRTGYTLSNDKCVKVVKKTCSHICTNTTWSNWSEWTTAYIAPSDNIEVETKVE